MRMVKKAYATPFLIHEGLDYIIQLSYMGLSSRLLICMNKCKMINKGYTIFLLFTSSGICPKYTLKRGHVQTDRIMK